MCLFGISIKKPPPYLSLGDVFCCCSKAQSLNLVPVIRKRVCASLNTSRVHFSFPTSRSKGFHVRYGSHFRCSTLFSCIVLQEGTCGLSQSGSEVSPVQFRDTSSKVRAQRTVALGSDSMGGSKIKQEPDSTSKRSSIRFLYKPELTSTEAMKRTPIRWMLLCVC